VFPYLYQFFQQYPSFSFLPLDLVVYYILYTVTIREDENE